MAEETVDNSFLSLARAFTENLYHCSRCNYCVEATWEERGIDHVCPTLRYHNPLLSYSGKGYLAAARALADGEEIPAAAMAERLFACTTCGNCEELCPVGLKPAGLVRALRADLVAHGAAPARAYILADNIANSQNPAGLPSAVRYKWVVGTNPAIDESAGMLYLPGCAACYGSSSEAAATVALLGKIGLPIRLPARGEDRCCGAPLFETGHPDAGRRQGNELLELIKRSGATAVLTSGAECLESFKSHYPAYLMRDADVPVMHIIELLHREIAEQRLEFRPAKGAALVKSIALMDSCHLSKKSHGSPVEAEFPHIAREILAVMGCNVVPEESSARFAICCGGAGGMPQIHLESSDRMAAGKLADFAETGADAVVCTSPLCAAHLKRSREDGLPPVYGFCEFIMKHFELAGRGVR